MYFTFSDLNFCVIQYPININESDTLILHLLRSYDKK